RVRHEIPTLRYSTHSLGRHLRHPGRRREKPHGAQSHFTVVLVRNPWRNVRGQYRNTVRPRPSRGRCLGEGEQHPAKNGGGGTVHPWAVGHPAYSQQCCLQGPLRPSPPT